MTIKFKQKYSKTVMRNNNKIFLKLRYIPPLLFCYLCTHDEYAIWTFNESLCVSNRDKKWWGGSL